MSSPSPVERTNPRPARLLVVGVGSIGERHVRCFQSTGRVELAICESNTSVRRHVAHAYGVTAYAHVGDVVTGEFDAVVIATPADTHLDLAARFAEAGLDVLIEKPLSTSESGLDALKTAIKRKPSKVAVAYVLRCHPVIAALKQAVDSDALGDPLQVNIVGGQHFPTYRPAYRETYYTRHETGGGAIQDALTHFVNAAEWIAGPINAIACDAAHQALADVDVEDTVHLIARHDIALTSIALNQHQAPNETSITIACRNGTIRGELHSMRVMTMSEPESPWSLQVLPTIERDQLFVEQAHRFLDYRSGDQLPHCSLDEAVATMRVCRTALEIAQTSLVSVPTE